MELKETAQLLMSIKTTYNRWFDGDKEEFGKLIEFWHKALRDVPYEVAQKALVDFSKESQYPPTIADIYKPYKEYLEEQKQLKREYNNIYYTAISFYPCYQDTPELKNEWNRLCGNNIPKANRLMNKIIDFVREQELADEYIPPILEWMKGLEKIE